MSGVCVFRGRGSHGDRHGHWHGDKAQQWPSVPRIPWCDPGQLIIDASVTGHCIHCCLTQTGGWFVELVVCFVCTRACVCLYEQRWVTVLATVRMSSVYTHCGREGAREWVRDRQRTGDCEIIWRDTKTGNNLECTAGESWDVKIIAATPRSLPENVSSWNAGWQLTVRCLTWASS